MSINRRNFNKFSLLGLSSFAALPHTGFANAPARAPLKILIMGGTGFLGPHIVNTAVAAGHIVTLFNRGKKANPFPELELLKGNRNGKLEALKDRQWDVVIDTSSFKPPQVLKSAQLLAPNVPHYIYISSTSVYKDWSTPSINEDAPTYQMNSPDGIKLDSFQRYGAAKAACEARVRKVYSSDHTVIRPNTIVGPGDHKHFRYGYWVRRATMDGEILGPGNAGDAIQFIDARDLGEWIVHCAEERVQGTFTASSPAGGYTMGDLIGDCLKVAEKDTPVTWIPSDFLFAQGPLDFPFWAPLREAMPGTGHLDVSKAIANGLLRRDPLTTASDTLQWYQGLGEEEKKQFKVGVSPEREQELIALWRASAKATAGS